MNVAPTVGLLLGPRFAEAVECPAGETATASIGGRTIPCSVRSPGESAAATASRVRAVCTLGPSILLVVDDALPVRPDWSAHGGRFALVADHLNLTGDNPLVGQNDPEWGPRFQDLTDAWDPTLRAVLRRAALESGIELREGIVAGVPVSSRTTAERGMLRVLGADMASTGFVAEAITGRHAGRRMAGLAVTSDQGAESLETVLGPFVAALEGADISE
mgnify:CR=1 FL=1